MEPACALVMPSSAVYHAPLVQIHQSLHLLIAQIHGTSALSGLLATLLDSYLRAQPARSQLTLPLLTCLLAGGAPVRAVPVGAAWTLLRLAAGMLDDLQDEGGYRRAGFALTPAVAMNAATALIFLAPLALQCGLAQRPELQHLCADLHHAGFHTCLGQHDDLSDHGQTPATLDAYWHMAGAKSGACLAWVCKAGCLVGGGSPAEVAACESYGYNLAVLAQIGNDWGGLSGAGGVSDLALGKQTLPVVYALTVADAPARGELLELLGRARVCPQAQQQARRAIIGLGGLHYTLVVAELWRRRACAALAPLPDSPARAALLALARDTFAVPRPAASDRRN